MIRVTERIGSKSPLVPPKHSRGLAEGTNSEHLSFQNVMSHWRTPALPQGCVLLSRRSTLPGGVTYTPANQRQQGLSLSPRLQAPPKHVPHPGTTTKVTRQVCAICPFHGVRSHLHMQDPAPYSRVLAEGKGRHPRAPPIHFPPNPTSSE